MFRAFRSLRSSSQAPGEQLPFPPTGSAQALLEGIVLPEGFQEESAAARMLWSSTHQHLTAVTSAQFAAQTGSLRVGLACSCTLTVAVPERYEATAQNMACMPSLEVTSCRMSDRDGSLVVTFFSDSWCLSLEGQPALADSPSCASDTTR